MPQSIVLVLLTSESHGRLCCILPAKEEAAGRRAGLVLLVQTERAQTPTPAAPIARNASVWKGRWPSGVRPFSKLYP